MNIVRIRILSFVVFTAAALIITRLFYIQIIHGSEYSENADRQYASPSGSVYDRGTVMFKERDGDLISAATLKNGYIVAINPEDIKDASTTLNKLSSVISLDHGGFFAKVQKKNNTYGEVARRVSKEDAEKITKLKLEGVSLYKEKWRFYPAGALAAHVLGFVAYKGDDLTGRYGLEKYYNEVLDRKGSSLYVNFFAEVFADFKDSLFAEADKREGDIVTTIDPAIQSALEKELASVMEKYGSEITGGIVMDPKDGRIYAMAKVPSFDLNKFKEVADMSFYNNELVEGAYEMGSIVKALTMGAALDAGVVTADTKYNDTGSLTFNGRTIYNFDHKGRGWVNMQDVLDESLNTGAVYAMKKLGKEQFKNYFLAYGFGEKTGIDLPGEGRNLISNLYTNRDIEFANASFGQGLAFTPISAVRALAVLGNGGYLVTPHIVQRIDYKGGFSTTPDFPKGNQVIKPATSDEITRMLVNVFDTALLGGTVKMEHYSIAAKTGTAQLTKEDGTGYYSDRFLHSFFGYFPAYDPKFIIFLFTRNPHGELYASRTLTVPFMNLAKFLINYYELPPDR